MGCYSFRLLISRDVTVVNTSTFSNTDNPPFSHAKQASALGVMKVDTWLQINIFLCFIVITHRNSVWSKKKNKLKGTWYIIYFHRYIGELGQKVYFFSNNAQVLRFRYEFFCILSFFILLSLSILLEEWPVGQSRGRSSIFYLTMVNEIKLLKSFEYFFFNVLWWEMGQFNIDDCRIF